MASGALRMASGALRMASGALRVASGALRMVPVALRMVPGALRMGNRSAPRLTGSYERPRNSAANASTRGRHGKKLCSPPTNTASAPSSSVSATPTRPSLSPGIPR